MYIEEQHPYKNKCWELMTSWQNGQNMLSLWSDMTHVDSEEEAKEESSHMTAQEAVDLITSLEECWDGDEDDEYAVLYNWIDEIFQADGDLSWLTGMFYHLFRYTL